MSNLIKTLSNLPGWRTNRKIVVFESDDWGSLRMTSTKSYDELQKAGIILNKGNSGRYNKYDTLASKADLEFLFETLSCVKDKNGSNAKITALSLVANPDFEKIKENNFSKYVFEPFTVTLERQNKANAFELWREGLDHGIFVPEFHGREHLNVASWMRALQNMDADAICAFDFGVWGYARKKGSSFQAAFELELPSDIDMQKEILTSGLSLFEKIHGYKALFFVPPNGPLNNELEKVSADSGIKFLSTSKIHKEPKGNGNYKKHFRYIGKTNTSKQIYITRNAFFEPSDSTRDEVSCCLAEIESAFKFKKPAVISSHRVNYVGGLDESNRDRSLNLLKELLIKIVTKWPDVEFLTSTELGNMISRRLVSDKKV